MHIRANQPVFTDQELAIIGYVAEGLTNIQIAERMQKTIASIGSAVKQIKAKLNVNTRMELAIRYHEAIFFNHLTENQ